MGATVRELRLLGGVTAAGKSEWALAWARENGTEILSCDSVSCYRGLDVGSAKPGPAERRLVPHHGLDRAEVNEVFGVGQYHEYAEGVVSDAMARSAPLIVVGGSGFFLEGFLRPVVDGLEVSASLRKRVDGWYEKEGLEGCVNRLRRISPSGLGSLDLLNQARVRRALERCMQAGKEYLELLREFEALPRPYADYAKHMVWLDRADEDIEQRIAARTRGMLENGLIEETREAIDRGMGSHPSLRNAVGYREARWLLEGRLNEEDLLPTVIAATRKLVSKQRKWFRKRFPPASRTFLVPEQEPDTRELKWVSGA